MMKRLLSLMLALMLCIPALSLAEDLPELPDLNGTIGGADELTGITLVSPVKLPQQLGEDAIAAGRKVTSTMTFTEFTGFATGDSATDAAIADLLAAMGLRVSRQGDEYDLALTLSGQDALTLGVVPNGQDCYIKSNLLGGTIVVNADELEPLIGRVLDMMVLMEAMTEAEAESLREEMSVMLEAFTEQMASSMASAAAMQDLSSLNTKALEDFAALVADKVTPVEEIVVPRMCDPAVSGAKAVLTNEDMVACVKAIYQFLLDNPTLMDYIGQVMGYSTEVQLEAAWKSYGDIYQSIGMYESKEAFLADNETFAQYIASEMAQADTRKMLDGEMVITVYTDAEDLPVYATLSLPLYIEATSVVDSAKVNGRTHQMDAVYTRQTVAAGVAHTLNFTYEGDTLTLDVLHGTDVTTIALNGVSASGEGIKLMDATVNTADGLNVEANYYDDNEMTASMLLTGESEFNDARSYFAGKLTVTAYEDGVPTTVVLEVSSNYVIDGVDFSGNTKVRMEAEGKAIGVQMYSATFEPEASIMSGDVTRPAELDDAAFSNWFVRVINNLNSWLSTVIMMLPESVLTLVLSAM